MYTKIQDNRRKVFILSQPWDKSEANFKLSFGLFVHSFLRKTDFVILAAIRKDTEHKTSRAATATKFCTALYTVLQNLHYMIEIIILLTSSI